MITTLTWMTCGDCGTQFSTGAITYTLCPGCKREQLVPDFGRFQLQTRVDGSKLVMPRLQPADTNMGISAYCLTCKYRRGNRCVLLHDRLCYDVNPRHDCKHWGPRRPIRDGLLMFAGAGLGAIGASIAWLIGII